jgi:hypothetical protein
LTPVVIVSEDTLAKNSSEARMADNDKQSRIRLPKPWNTHVRSTVLHVISLAQSAVA